MQGGKSIRALVFGGSGFIGNHMIRELVSRGNSVVSVDIKAPQKRLQGVTYLMGDVRDLSSFDPGMPIDRIYNFAAIHTTPGHSDAEYYETNVAGATQVTAFARKHDIDDIVFTSSISVYGAGEETKSEDSVVAPQSPYGWSKWLAEGIHRTWLDDGASRNLVIVRPAVVFGPGEGGNFSRLVKLLRTGYFVYPGRKDTIKGCIYVDDLIDAILFAESLSERSILFNACYPDRYTLEQIVDTLKREYFSTVRTFCVPGFVVRSAAKLLSFSSALGLGIHPDRVTKLMRSTDVVPGWLMSRNHASSGKLPSAFLRWQQATGGRFD